jgi:hypothetical protein
MAVREDFWPGGTAGLRKLSDQLRSEGILLGIHTGSASIFCRDGVLASPKPDDRLAGWGGGKLAKAVGPEDDVVLFQPEPGLQVPVISPNCAPLRPPVYGRFWNADWVRIGDEVIRVGQFHDTDKPVWRLTGCQRGANGTKAVAHEGQDLVRGLLVGYGQCYAPDVESTLYTQTIDNLAAVVNGARIARISFDAVEFSDYDGYWASNKFMLKSFEKFDHSVACESSAGVPQYQWHISSFQNVGEGMHTLPRGYWEGYIENSCQQSHANFLPAAMGAYTFRLDAPEQLASSPDEWEWQLAKAAAWDGCFFFETSMDYFKKHGQTDRILELVRHWEAARIAGAFSDSQREQMKPYDMSFRLAVGKGKWSVTPVKIQTHYIQSTGGSLSLDNPFGRQEMRFEARVLSGLDYADANNIPLLPASLSELKIAPDLTIHSVDGNAIAGRQGGQGQAKREPTVEDYLAIMGTGATGAPATTAATTQPASATAVGGAHTLLLTATNDKRVASGPVQADWMLPAPLNLLTHRGVGLWVTGDGKGEYLFVELEDAKWNMVRKYVTKIDFVGRRYIEIPTGLIASERYYDLGGWNNGWHSTKLGFDYNRIQRVSLGFVAIPPQAQIRCVVEAPKALAEQDRPLQDLTLALPGGELKVHGAVDPGQYMVYEGGDSVEVLDTNRHTLRTLPVSRKDWQAQGGSSEVTVTSQGAGPYLRLQFKPLGPPFEIPDPTAVAQKMYDEITR